MYKKFYSKDKHNKSENFKTQFLQRKTKLFLFKTNQKEKPLFDYKTKLFEKENNILKQTIIITSTKTKFLLWFSCFQKIKIKLKLSQF